MVTVASGKVNGLRAQLGYGPKECGITAESGVTGLASP
jgi:hypothetical protein